MDLSAAAVEAYLDRIGFTEPVRADLATLELLQRAHMTAVPFENLHVFHQRGVATSAEWSVPKVVEQRRGGWCFELNGAFGTLLSALGFRVTRLGAVVVLDGLEPSASPDHLTLRVDLDEPYLVDVGFGESFIRPLRLGHEGPQDGGDATYRLRPGLDAIILERDEGGQWSGQYRFTQAARELEDFADQSHYLQSTPSRHWTEAPFATRLIDNGPDRVWLLRNRMKIRRDGEIVTTQIPIADWDAALQKWFGMTP